MSVGFATARAQLVQIVQGVIPKSQPKKRFVVREREPDGSLVGNAVRQFWLEPAAPPRADEYVGPSFRIAMTMMVLYVGLPWHALQAMATEDAGLLQLDLATPDNHGGPLATGVLAVTAPTATSWRRLEGDVLLASMSFDLIYQETP